MKFGKDILVIFSLAVLLVSPALADSPTGSGAYIASKQYVDTKQDKLGTANQGANVTITRETSGVVKISATDTKYTAGAHINIDNDNKISAKDFLSGVTASSTGTGYIVQNVTASGGTVTVSRANVQVPNGSQNATTYVPVWVQ